MTDVQIEAGTLEANLDTRSVTALLVPYGEVGRTNLGRFEIPKGTISIPRDPSVVMANIDHQREFPVGPATSLLDTDAGTVATFRIADTDEGDALLAAIDDKRKEGKPMAVSAEIKNVVLRGGKAVSGVLFGAAFVDQGAFPSAALMASDVGEEPVTTEEHTESEYTDGNGVKWRRVVDSETTAEPNKTTTTTTVVEETEEPEEGTEPKEETVGLGSSATDTLEASAATVMTPRTSLRDLTLALASASGPQRDKTLLASLAEPDGDTLFAALSDIKFDYAGSVGVAIVQPGYTGELWKGRSYARRYIPLLAQAPLTSLKEVGWHWTEKPAVAKWSGNKSAVPSNTPATDDDTWTAQRWAGAHDHAREFTDFGVTEYWDAYLKAMTESYARETDLDAVDQLIAAATTVAAGSVPTGINKATAALIDGALATLDKDVPTYAIVGKDVFRALLLQNDSNLIETLSLSLGLEDGTLDTFRIVPSSKAALNGKVLVGTRAAATFKELPGSPIRVNAEDLARGGIDTGFFGYAGVKVEEPLGLSLVTVAA